MLSSMGKTKIMLPTGPIVEVVTTAEKTKLIPMIHFSWLPTPFFRRTMIPSAAATAAITAEKIRKAERGATLLIETRRWISFHQMVMQALADRPDVTLNVSFLDGEYRGNRMTFTIPAGTDAISLPNVEGYCGFLYLGGIFGLHPAEGN